MARSLLALLLGLAALAPGGARAVELSGNFMQGGLVIGRTQPESYVEFNGRRVRVAADGKFLIGFGRDAPEVAVLNILRPDAGQEVLELIIAPRRYGRQDITGLDDAMVTPPEDAKPRIARDANLVAQVRARDSEEAWFLAGFTAPADGPISGVYGTERTLNGLPRQPHYGLDIAAPLGASVRAVSDGRISLAENDLYFSGGTVIIDHGHGLSSTYSHLEQIVVASGEFVRQGAVIGAVGDSGRSTGPHLDWRVNWFEARLDPQLLLEEKSPLPVSRLRN